MAAWLAPPPIQLPAIVVNPRHTASKPAPPTVSGENIDTIRIAMGPPMMMPTVPVYLRSLRPMLQVKGIYWLYNIDLSFPQK